MGATSAGVAQLQTAPAASETQLEVQGLIVQAKEGNQAAFGKLYRLHVTSVYKYLSYRLRDTATVEDLTAEVFLRALRKIHTYEDRGIDFSAWLMRIARNILLDHVKSSGTRLEVVGIAESETNERSVPGSDLEVLDRLDREELHAALNRLRPEHQEVLYLRFLQGFSSAETADAMGKTEGAIRVLQFRALKQLLKIMQSDQAEVR